MVENAPLPLSKSTRVWFEALRTGAALSTVCLNACVLLRVFHVI